MEGLNEMIKNGSWFICNNTLILKKWHPDVNLLKEDVGTVPFWFKLHGVPVTAFSEDGLSAIATKLGLAMLEHTIELRANVELKDNIVAAMPKIIGEGYYTCVVATKNPKKTSQTPKEIPIGQKSLLMKVSKSNSFDELNSVDNDVELGTNGGSSHLASQEANYSGSSFWNAESSSLGTTLIFEKINKMENLIIDRNAILVDNEGNPLRKVDDNSEDEVALVDNEIASFLAKKDGYGTQSLLEEWKDSS
ncbi:pyruvate, phosphate dikinase, chloroplastic [Tanacetum coccineum]